MISIKSKNEIKKIKAAGDVLADVMEAIRKNIRPGISTYELDQIARKVYKKAGAKATTLGYGNPPYPAATCLSVDEVVVHGIPSKDVILKEGQIISSDLVVGLNGWMADGCRTFPVGEISQEKQDLITAAKDCFYAGLEQCKPGNHIRDISAAVEEVAESRGYGIIREFTGHGIGTDMHEDPSIPNYTQGLRRGPRLEKGMVICIEPMISLGSEDLYIDDDGWTAIMKDGKAAAHYENTVVITDNEPIILTQMDY